MDPVVRDVFTPYYRALIFKKYTLKNRDVYFVTFIRGNM